MVPLLEMGSDDVEGTKWWTFRQKFRWSKFPSSKFFAEKSCSYVQETVKERGVNIYALSITSQIYKVGAV